MASGRVQGLFVQDESDEDSIATDTTVDSERSEYPVEKVLLEERDAKDKRMRYLIKWEGYPLGQATWETLDSIENAAILQQWEEQKAAIAQGKAEPFKIDDFYIAVDQNYQEEQAKALRREAKRKKRKQQAAGRKKALLHSNQNETDESKSRSASNNHPVLSKSLGSVPGDASTSRPQTKKGVARPVSRRAVTSSDSEDEEIHMESDVDSLFGESKRPVRTPQIALHTAKDAPASRPPSSKTSKPNLQGKVAPLLPPPVDPKPKASPLMAKRMKKDVPRKQRLRVSGATPKNSTEAQYKSLATLGRYQMYSRQNEPPPDYNKLVLLDAKTGKPQTGGEGSRVVSRDSAPSNEKPRTTQPIGRQRLPSPDTRRTSVQVPGAADSRGSTSAYDRRSPPPSARRRSDSPKPRESDPRILDGGRIAPLAEKGRDALAQFPKTCKYWAFNKCRFPADVCHNAHAWANPDVIGAKNVTCYFWRTRHVCAFTDTDCRYAHHDTGYWAGPPGADATKNSAESGVAKSGELRTQEVTCYYWNKGGCSNPNCKFAHRDTGVYAGRPGTYVKGAGQKFMSSSLPSNIPDAPAPTTANASLVTDDPPRHTKEGHTSQVNASRSLQSHVDLPILESHPDPPPMQMDDRPMADPHRERDSFTTGFVHSDRRAMMDHSRRDDRGASSSDASHQAVQSHQILTTEVFIAIQWEDEGPPTQFLAQLEYTKDEMMGTLAASPLSLRVQHTVMAGDFEAVIWQEGLRPTISDEGRLVAGPNHAAAAQSLIQLCKLSSSGLIAVIEGKPGYVLVYPSNAEEWKFLPRQEHVNTAADPAALRFRLVSNLPGLLRSRDVGKELAAPDRRTTDVAIGTDLLGLDVDRLLPKENGKHVEGVFLMIPPTRHLELELLARFFQGQSCKVYQPGTPGAWQYFLKKHGRASLVVIHPDVPLEKVPRLHAYIAQYGSGMRFFSIGIDAVAAMHAEEQPSYKCLRLFPNGQVFYLTDDALLDYPNESTSIVHFIIVQNERPHSHSKIAMRLDVKTWLLDLVAEKQDPRHVALYEAICKLCPDEDEDPMNPPHALPTSSLLTIPTDAMPNASNLNDEDRSDYLVNWFAGWAVEHATMWRLFIVCVAPPKGSTRMVFDADGKMALEIESDPRGWAKMYQHVGFLTPFQMYERFCERR